MGDTPSMCSHLPHPHHFPFSKLLQMLLMSTFSRKRQEAGRHITGYLAMGQGLKRSVGPSLTARVQSILDFAKEIYRHASLNDGNSELGDFIVVGTP